MTKGNLAELSTVGYSTSEGLKIQAKVIGIYSEASAPTLRLQFEFVSVSDQEYTILPFVCELYLEHGPFASLLYLGNSPVYQGGSTSTYLQDTRVVPPRGICTLYSPLELGFGKVNGVDEIRKNAKKKDLHLKIGLYGWVRTEKEEVKTIGTRIENIVVAESEWVDWLKGWGKEVRLIQLSGIALRRFDELKKNWKADDTELVALMTDKFTGTEIKREPEFICTLPDKRTIEEISRYSIKGFRC